MIYLASPYSHPSAEIVFERVKKTEEALGYLVRNGEHVWSPIIQYHAVAVDYSLPTDAAFWWNINRDFIRRCDEVLVLQLQDWEHSKGVAMELELAQFLEVPIHYITPRSNYARSPSPWIFTKHEEIMKSDRELIEAATEKDRIELSLADLRIPRK